MTGCLRKIVGRALILILLVVAAYAGWRWGPQVFPRLQEWVAQSGVEEDEGNPASPALADSVVAQVQELRRGGGSGRMAFGDRELTSVLRYSVPGLIPDGVAAPKVSLGQDRVRLGARVALAVFPDLPDLGPILGILPDTLDVVLEASMMPFGPGRAALMVHGLEASRIPLPRRLIPEILAAMGRSSEPGLPPEAILVPLPSGVGAAYILGDSLILSNDL
jgi:hypothetical protein